MSDEKVRINRLQSIASSAAGPGSDFFRHYRAHRDKELDRVKEMEAIESIAREEEMHATKVRLAKERIEAKTVKNREKRHKRKEHRLGVAIPAEIKEMIVSEEIESSRAAQIEKEDPQRDEAKEPVAKVMRVGNTSHPGIRILVEDDL